MVLEFKYMEESRFDLLSFTCCWTPSMVRGMTMEVGQRLDVKSRLDVIQGVGHTEWRMESWGNEWQMRQDS